MKKFYIILLLLFDCIFKITAQEILTIQEVQKIALENNFGLKASEKNIELSNNYIYNGNTGKSPIIDWNNSVSNSINQVHQKYIDGRDIQRIGNSFTPLSNVSLLWTLYDGKRMYATLDKLKTLNQQDRILNQVLIQNTLASVMQAYYDIARLQKSTEYLKQIIDFYETRLKITDERWQIGRGSKLDFIQSKTDLMTQKSNLINTEGQLKVAKFKLNGLMGRSSTDDFKVNDTKNLVVDYNLENLLDLAKAQNPEFLNLKKAEEASLLDEKIAGSYKLPKISLNSSFGYSLNKSNANLISFNQNIGLNTGITATWRLFDGKTAKHNIEAAKINQQIIVFQQQDWVNNIKNQLLTSYQQFKTNKELLGIEEENKILADENLKISLEKFKLGASTILELNDAQTRFNTALNRLVNAQYNANVSELELLKYSGQLIH